MKVSLSFCGEFGILITTLLAHFQLPGIERTLTHTTIYVLTYICIFEKLLVTASPFGLHPFLQSKLLHSTKDFPYKVKEAC